ncbi:MAG: hypothetical protein FWE06_04055 [Oscillospiraceae bacterium]|nr:hypothetical protein [Oscillospiraceae bacterium]
MSEKKFHFDCILYYIAVALLPSILLFRLYNRNHADSFLFFTHVLIVAAFFAVASLLFFIFLQLFLKSRQAALLVTLGFWVAFWLFEPVFRFSSRIGRIFGRRITLITLLFIGFAAAVLLLRKFKPPFEKIRPAFDAFTFAVIALFLFNLFPGVNQQIILARARANVENETLFYIKQGFNVDRDISRPDIYWFHMDGMMSLETVEDFWGEDQQALRDALAERGFLIYPNASLNAGFTYAALPALLSPAFYDSFWGELLAKHENELRASKTQALSDALTQVGLTYVDNLIPNYELFAALIAARYDIEIIGNVRDRIPSNLDHLSVEHRYTLPLWRRFPDGDLARLLTLATPLRFDPEPERILVQTRDENFVPEAHFLWREFMYTHLLDNPLTGGSSRYYLYPPAFEYATEQMLYHIDLVLSENPNAVIVLQSDHGFHLPGTQGHLVEQGYPMEQILTLIHSTFSAVRIPPAYGGLDAPLEPRNITRELVNRFVGENYALLP